MAKTALVRQPYSVAVLSTGGRLHPSFLRREGLVRMWSSLWKGRRRDSKKIPSLMGKAMPVSAMKARFQIAECSSLYQQGRTGWYACKAILTIMWCNQNEYNEQRGTTKDWLFPFVRLEAIVSGVSVISDFPINYRLAVIGGEEGLEDDANAKILAAL